MCQRCLEEGPKMVGVYVGPEDLNEQPAVISPDGVHVERWVPIVCSICETVGQIPERLAPTPDDVPVCPDCQRKIRDMEDNVDLPTAFADLPADAFPFTMKYFDVDTREVYLEQTVDGPGALHVPPKPDHVRWAGVTVIFANGEEHTFEG